MKIKLLGTPAITAIDGTVCTVRGLQSWAVLARVLLSDRPVARRQLAGELFPDTVDPLGALRWCLASLRRALGPETMAGDPVTANLPVGSKVDALAIDETDFDPLLSGELLENSEPEASGSDFETWLLVERARLSVRLDARLRRDTLNALTLGEGEASLRLARHMVQRQPYDEVGHIQLIRALVLSGQPEAARAHADRTEADFLRELGERPSPALRSAARAKLADPPHGDTSEVVIQTLLQAGSAALEAGAVEAGLDSLRRAATMAEAIANTALQAVALAELGTALIHSVRGQDDEGIIHLHRAEELGLQNQNRAVACRAVLELSYAEALAGRRPDADQMSQRAFNLADADPVRLATAHAFTGFNYADWGRFAEADVQYDLSLSAARTAQIPRREGWTFGLGSWGKLRAGNAELAKTWAKESLTICASLNWLSFRPWPEAVLAEAELTLGKAPDEVRRQLEPTLAMSCQLTDPCWEAAACRVIALAHEKDGKLSEALRWLDRAARSFASVTDPYAALLVRILLDRTRLTLATNPSDGQALLRSLLVTAARLYAEPELDAALAMRNLAATRLR